MRRVPCLVLLLVLLCQTLQAIPARKPSAVRTQPDGSVFKVLIRGDEWMKIVTTEDGCAIAQDADGWWCYAEFDAAGRKYPSGARVGSAASPDVITRSRNIPYRQMRMRASARRAELRAATPARRFSAVTRGGDGLKEHRILVILTQFDDVKFSYGRDMFVDMLTKDGYSYNGATGSAQQYFNHQLEGYADVKIDVSSIVSLSQPVAYYGKNDADGNDEKAAELVEEACRLAHDDAANPIDFSRYDLDGDGIVDNVFVFVAGSDEADGADENLIWSHSWSLKSAGINLHLDGKAVDDYAISTELMEIFSGHGFKTVLSGIGTFCHESGHILGLPDYYDTDYEDSGGKADAMWHHTALMDGGNSNNNGNTPPNFNAVSLEELGLGTCETITEGNYTLKPISQEKRYMKIEGDYPGEYYLLECRDNTGWDAYIKGKGLCIYHIDKSNRHAGYSTGQSKSLTAYNRWYQYNEVNCRPDHQCADMIEASPSPTNVKQAFFPYGSVRSFTPSTNPAMKWWSGNTPEIGIRGITLAKDGSVSFTVGGEMSITELTVFQDAAIIAWEGTGSKCKVMLGDEQVAEVAPYESGKFACVLQHLAPYTDYTVTLSADGASSTKSFKTKSYYTGSNPFIYVNGAERDDAGRFITGTRLPLRVYNAPDAVSISWTMNGRPVQVGGDGYYVVTGSGILRAEVNYEDGSRDIIIKEITTR